MELALDFLKLYGSQLSAIGAALAFIFGIYKFQVERKATFFWKEFEVFHKLVKELVEPPSEQGAMYVDRQAAVMFELRNFKRSSRKMGCGTKSISSANRRARFNH